MRIVAYAAVTFFTPVFGFIMARFGLGDVGSSPIASGFAQLTPRCVETVDELLPDGVAILWMCGPASIAHGLEFLSLGVGATALALTGVVVASARYADTGDFRLARILPPITWAYIVTVNVLAIPRLVILVFLCYLVLAPTLDPEAETYRVNILWVLGFAVTISVLSMGANLMVFLVFLLRLLRRPILWGTVVGPGEAMGLRDLIVPIARRLGVSPPSNIVARMDPNFAVTNEKFRTPGRPGRHSGHTLLVSAPMFRLLTTEELISVIGHELGHLKRRDIAISMIVREPFEHLDGLFGESKTKKHARWRISPIMSARVCMNFLIDSFVHSVRSLTRNAEFKADDASLRVASAEAMVTSILKFVIYAMVVVEEMPKTEGGIYDTDCNNLSVKLAELARRKLEPIADSELIAYMRNMDPMAKDAGHIGFEERFARLGYSLEQAVQLLPRTIDKSVEGLLGDANDIERRATKQLREELSG